MTMTYQQEFVLSGAAGRAAILNLNARYNRAYSAQRPGRLARCSVILVRELSGPETFTDLRAAFNGGGGERLVTVDHEISVDGVDATQQCVALLFVGTELRATGTYRDEADR